MSPPGSYPSSPLFDDVDNQGEKPSPGRIVQAETSLAAAWARVEPHRRPIYERIVAIVSGRGPLGATLSELAIALRKEKCKFRGRLSELVAAGELQVLRAANGKEVNRDGCRVLVAAESAGTTDGAVLLEGRG